MLFVWIKIGGIIHIERTYTNRPASNGSSHRFSVFVRTAKMQFAFGKYNIILFAY